MRRKFARPSVVIGTLNNQKVTCLKMAAWAQKEKMPHRKTSMYINAQVTNMRMKRNLSRKLLNYRSKDLNGRNSCSSLFKVRRTLTIIIWMASKHFWKRKVYSVRSIIIVLIRRANSYRWITPQSSWAKTIPNWSSLTKGRSSNRSRAST